MKNNAKTNDRLNLSGSVGILWIVCALVGITLAIRATSILWLGFQALWLLSGLVLLGASLRKVHDRFLAGMSCFLPFIGFVVYFVALGKFSSFRVFITRIVLIAKNLVF